MTRARAFAVAKGTSRSRRQTRKNGRRAFLMIDMIMGIAVLALVFATTTFVLAGLTRQRRIASQHFLANETIVNILEEIETWESFPLEEAATDNIQLPANVIRRLPGAELRIDVATPPADGIAMQQITCQISWPSAAGQPPHRVALTAWRFTP